MTAKNEFLIRIIIKLSLILEPLFGLLPSQLRQDVIFGKCEFYFVSKKMDKVRKQSPDPWLFISTSSSASSAASYRLS